MKSVLMIHEIRPWMLDLDLEKYILTFDDGLYSQYYYREVFNAINTTKIFFISSNYISQSRQSLEFPACSAAHEKAFKGNTEDYMNIEQILELASTSNTIIGAHSHSHTRLNKFSCLIDRVDYIKTDTEKMLDWFTHQLNYTPEHFCFPYNEDLNGMYRGILKKYGFKYFYGNERIPIETLLHS